MKLTLRHLMMPLSLACAYSIAGAQANQSLSNLTSPTSVNQALLPSTNGTLHLGSGVLNWNDIYFAGALYNGSTRVFKVNTILYNLFAGSEAGDANKNGQYNTGLGYQALLKNKNGNSNTAVGAQTLFKNSKSTENTAFGAFSLHDNEAGDGNTGLGVNTLFQNISGDDNTAVGTRALQGNLSGSYNIAVGHFALNTAQTASNNVAIGDWSLWEAKASGNTAVGKYSLYHNGQGVHNSAFGDSADVTVPTLSNATAIGFYARVDESNKVRIGNTSVTKIGGQVGWSIFSDGRFKKNIKEDVLGLSFINSLRPVTYTVDTKSINNYLERNNTKGKPAAENTEIQKANEAASKIIYNGFIAQEVEASAKKLNYDFSGVDKPETTDGLYGLRYDNFVVPLVKAVQELSKINDDEDAKINDLQKQIDELKAMVLGNKSTSKTATVNSAQLDQNIPNPFRGNTTIKYRLPQQYTSAQMFITDKSGKTVKQLTLSGSGDGSVNIDDASLSGGTYHYSLMVDGKIVMSKQMVLVK